LIHDLNEVVNREFIYTIKERSFYGIKECKDLELALFREEFEQFIIEILIPETVRQEICVIDKTIKEFLEFVVVRTGSLTDVNHHLWGNYKNFYYLEKLSFVPRYSDLINISDIAPLSRGEGVAFGVV